MKTIEQHIAAVDKTNPRPSEDLAHAIKLTDQEWMMLLNDGPKLGGTVDEQIAAVLLMRVEKSLAVERSKRRQLIPSLDALIRAKAFEEAAAWADDVGGKAVAHRAFASWLRGLAKAERAKSDVETAGVRARTCDDPFCGCTQQSGVETSAVRSLPVVTSCGACFGAASRETDEGTQHICFYTDEHERLIESHTEPPPSWCPIRTLAEKAKAP